MATIKEYETLGIYINNIYDIIRNGANNLDELKRACLTDEVSVKTGLRGLPDSIIETIVQFLGKSYDSSIKVNAVIDEWNTNVAPILTGVTCNSFDEFAMQVANVAGQCIKYKSAESMQPQQPVPVQSQQNQMFVDVNTLVSENTYLKSLNASKDEEIKALRERLVALGQPV